MSYKWQTWLAGALRAEGCTVREYSNWQNRGRPASTGAYNPYAVGMHHTGTKTSTTKPNPTLSTIVNGRSDLPGPLAAGLIGYDGVIDLVAAGRCNHGGEAAATGPMPAGDANALYVGFEIDYDGTQSMSGPQQQAAVRAGAAVLRHFGRSVSYARQHNEWSVTGKWDCGGWDNNQMREQIADQLAAGGAPESEQENDMLTLLVTDGSGPSNVVYAIPPDLSHKMPLDNPTYEALKKLPSSYIRVDFPAGQLDRIPTIPDSTS